MYPLMDQQRGGYTVWTLYKINPKEIYGRKALPKWQNAVINNLHVVL